LRQLGRTALERVELDHDSPNCLQRCERVWRFGVSPEIEENATMSSDAMSVPAAALLEHQEFVRSLARSLLRDEHAAHDVAQDTLLASLTHPPRAVESMRAWLAQVTRNRVRSVAREEMRRARREQAAARSDVDESESKLHERLELQHRVVQAVLGLKEPYKTVIVLSYYEGLSPTEIAARRKLPSGTVRAQLSRAHEMLRQKLDAEFGGERKAWSVGLVALVARSKRVGVGVTTKILAAGLLVGAVVIPFAWWRITQPSRGESVQDEFGRVWRLDTESISVQPGENATARSSGSRVPAVAALRPGAQPMPPQSELDAMSNEGKQIQLLLRERLLTPDRAIVEARRDLAALTDVRFARLWQRYALGGDMNNAVGLSGAGAYLSFATGVQDDIESDLSFEQRFNSGGGGSGAVVLLEGVRLANLASDASPCPPLVDAESWNTLWAESKMDARSIPTAFHNRMSRVGQIAYATSIPVVGGTYLVRSLRLGEHDLLGAFEVVARDQKSVTIAWRVLKRWDVPRTRAPSGFDPLTGVEKPPASLSSLSTDELVARREALAARAARMVLDVPEELASKFAAYAAEPHGGLARIAERSRWDGLLSMDGGGACWSFTQRSNDYQKEAQIMLQDGRFSAGFAGSDRGYVLDLGEVAMEQVSTRGRSPALDERGQESAAFLWSLIPSPISAQGKDLAISAEDQARARELELDARGAPAVVGHSYLVRCVQPGRRDVLAAFEALARDEGAMTIAWKILREMPAYR
jgi:RNA polymerase sigma-70 factor (ECF subfamily)